MASTSDDSCLVCLGEAGGNLNIFTTYNICHEKEESYVEVIKNCFNIQITPDSGLCAMCKDCSIKLRKAYNFKHDIMQAVNKLLSAQVTDTAEEDKQYSEIEYLEDIPFDNDYDINTILNPVTGQISYTVDKINQNQETNKTDQKSFMIDLDNDEIVDKKEVESSEVNSVLNAEDCQLYTDRYTENALLMGDIEDKGVSKQNDEKNNKDETVVLNLNTGEISFLEVNNENHELSKADNGCVDRKDESNINESKKNVSNDRIDILPSVDAGCPSYTLDKIHELDPGTYLMDVDNDELEKGGSNSRKCNKLIKKYIIKKLPETVKENVPGNVEDTKASDNVEDIKASENVEDIRASENVEDKKADKDNMKQKRGKKSKPLIQCKLCEAEFRSNRALTGHMNTHCINFACSVCGLHVTSKVKLRAHERTHEEGPFYCKLCDQEFMNVNTRNAHTWRVHSNPEPFKCSRCGQSFKTFLKRLRHVQAAHGDSPQYPCPHCEKSFAYAAYRTRHIRVIHLNKRPHKCEQCPSAFARRSGLAAHLASKHGVGELRYQCAICSRRFYVKTALGLHMNTHKEKFECSQCDQKFKTSLDLEMHSKTHDSLENISINLDFVTSLHLDVLTDDYSLIDPYLDLNEL